VIQRDQSIQRRLSRLQTFEGPEVLHQGASPIDLQILGLAAANCLDTDFLSIDLRDVGRDELASFRSIYGSVREARIAMIGAELVPIDLHCPAKRQVHLRHLALRFRQGLRGGEPAEPTRKAPSRYGYVTVDPRAPESFSCSTSRM
jgi:hypothetical protein